MEKHYSLRSVGDSWGKSEATLRRMIRLGRLRAVKVGSTWRVPQSEVERVERGSVEEDAAA